MTTTKDGGPAFPSDVPDVTGGHWDGKYELLAHHDGMSQLAWFAGMALQGMLAYPGDESGSWHNNATPAGAARMAFDFAEAMLAELAKRSEADEVQR